MKVVLMFWVLDLKILWIDLRALKRFGIMMTSF